RRGRAGVGADPGSDRRGSGRDDRRRRCAVGGPRRHPLAAQARPPRPGRAAGGGERRPARPHGGRDHAGVGDRRLPWPARRRLPGGVRPDRLGQGGPVPARGADRRPGGRCPNPHRDGLIPRCRGDGDRPVLKSRATSGSDSPLPLGLTPFGRRYLPPASGRGTCPGFGFFAYVAVSGVEGGAVRTGRRGDTVVFWLASLAPPPGLRPFSPVLLPLHGGEVLWGVIVSAPLSLPLHGGDVRLASLDFSPSLLGECTKCRGGAVRRTARELQGVSWLASLAPPPGLRPYSPVPLPLHGGEVLWEVIVSAPLSLPLHGGEVRLASLDFSPSLLGEWHEVPRGRGPYRPPGRHCGLLARFARAPSPPSAVLPRSAAAPRGRSPWEVTVRAPCRCRSTGETSDWPLWISP